MNQVEEIEIKFSLESPQQKNKSISIDVESHVEEKLEYKFFIGINGVWNTIKNFDKEQTVKWTPKEDGKYTIMVQARKKHSKNMFDYVCRRDFIIGKVEEKLITNIIFNKDELKVGEKIKLNVESNKSPLMYRYWIREDYSWSIVKDYSPNNELSLTLRNPGEHEILVECKDVCSNNNYDDFKRIQFKVNPLDTLEIVDFKCLSNKLLVDEELIFQVDVNCSENRIVLYKFIKISEDGSTKCIQDYSTKRMVSYIEDKEGEYKLLCYVKDMYSTSEYDDRAVLNFNVKKYETIEIKSFTTDKISPQVCNSEIMLKSVVSGGKNLIYRYIIKGQSIEDSDYCKKDSYVWIPKSAGKYNITFMVKDNSSKEKYEDCKSIDFIIDEKSEEPVLMKEIIVDKNRKILIDEQIEIEAIAVGGKDLRYSFIVKYDNQELNSSKYSTENKQTFCFNEPGKYQIEVRVKDKFSTRKYDSHQITYVEVCEYFPANIEYLLHPLKQYFVCGDKITVEAVVTNTTKALMKYVLKIDGRKVEETDYISSFGYVFSPKCRGFYELEVYAKNKKSNEIYDSKKKVKFRVHDTNPITNTKIRCNKLNVGINKSVMFNVECMGGKDNLYEFYIMEKGEWSKVQEYSKKNYYSFIPFSKGMYKILVLCKSSYKQTTYEDYDIYEFEVK